MPFLAENWLRCMAHVINLCCMDALKEIDHLKEKVLIHTRLL